MSGYSIQEAIKAFSIMQKDVPKCIRNGLIAATKLIKKETRELIGKEQSTWPALSPETERIKEAAGYPTNSPLLRTGELQNSFSIEVIGSKEGVVYTNDPVFVRHEEGTVNMPRRSMRDIVMYQNKFILQSFFEMHFWKITNRSLFKR